jgi:hypothetical protein
LALEFEWLACFFGVDNREAVARAHIKIEIIPQLAIEVFPHEDRRAGSAFETAFKDASLIWTSM